MPTRVRTTGTPPCTTYLPNTEMPTVLDGAVIEIGHDGE